MYDLGQTVRLAASVHDASGTLSNATTVTLTITLPDGTTTSPTVTNPPAQTGEYTVDYVPTQAGRHSWRLVATTPNDAYTDVFDVREAASRALVSLGDAKRHLNITAANTAHDAELREHIETTTDVIEDIIGPVVRRTVTETFSGRGTAELVLSYVPVISVTSVTEDGTAVDASGYSLGDDGVLKRVAGYQSTGWRYGVNNITVVTVVGRVVVRSAIREASLELLRVNFRPQLGGNYSPFDASRSEDQGSATRRLGFYVPNRVMQLLSGFEQPPGMA